jgi:hypothetical protein
LVGRKPGLKKWTTMSSQTETSNVPSLATKWLRNMLQVTEGQNTTDSTYLAKLAVLWHIPELLAVELHSKSNWDYCNKLDWKSVNKQIMYHTSWHFLSKGDFKIEERLGKTSTL